MSSNRSTNLKDGMYYLMYRDGQLTYADLLHCVDQACGMLTAAAAGCCFAWVLQPLELVSVDSRWSGDSN
jgi:hypothetical protein